MSNYSDALHRGQKPALYVAHVVLPHHPSVQRTGQLHEDISAHSRRSVKVASGKKRVATN